MPDILWIATGSCAAVGGLLIAAAVGALKRRERLRMSLRLLWALIFFTFGGALGAIALGVQGYSALTREEVAAVVQTQPIGNKRFRVQFDFPDGHQSTYVLAGDELYVDARILKWHPFANVFGLHTAYELDRVAGRYKNVGDEQRGPRTVYSLAPERTVDLFALRQRHALLAPLVDAEYGSATFVAASVPATYEVRVSISGLLARRSGPAARR